jgi:poly(A) polymerase
MPALSACYEFGHHWQVLSDIGSMVMAAASTAKANRGWPVKCTGLEPKGKNVLIGFISYYLIALQIYNGDRYHLMPIITPAYPSMCATHNITMSTKKIISNEMKRAAEIVDSIIVGQLQWKDLFSKHTFFTSGYKYYLSIVAASRSREAQLIWSGLVESKIRLLVSSLEQVEAIHLAHPFNKGFDRVHHCSTEDEVEKIINGDLQFQAKDIKTEKADLTSVPKHEISTSGSVENSNGTAKSEEETDENTIYTSTYYIGIKLKQGLEVF